MKILFENIEEFRACVPWLYATAKLDSFMLDIELATEDLIEVLGEEIYDRVLKAYNDGEQQEFDVELIRRFQLPIALNAYLSWSRNQDVSHEEDGRKVKIDKESESLPWQWMLDRDDAGIRDKAGKAVDRLIAFLDKNVESIVEWKESDQRKDMRSLFVSNATEFDSVIPIDRSRYFFLRVLPFVRSVDRDMVKYIGKERYDAIKDSMRTGTPSGEQERVIELCREVVPHLVMAKAVRRFSVKVLPDSVVTRFDSERQTRDASLPASRDLIGIMENVYTGDAQRGIVELQDYIKEITPGDGTAYVRKKTDYNQEKFFTV